LQKNKFFLIVELSGDYESSNPLYFLVGLKISNS